VAQDNIVFDAVSSQIEIAVFHSKLFTAVAVMGLVEKGLGKRIKGEADTDVVVSVENDLSDLFNALVQDAKKARP